ncbi:MAG: acyl-CoA desaturase [Verrucomicrobia bacterium]|nr:MAG: acyl-CoA desaturase [Verrucomicrobiota bacterium]
MRTFFRNVRWQNTVFLFSTFLTTVIGAPLYLWHYGVDLFQVALFFFFLMATGLSITLGYHRLFSHLTFQASPIIKILVLLFGSAAFEGTALVWCADHRRHHKFVDHEDDPYDITKGFFHAHIGWLLFRTSPDTPLTWVRDLQKDRLLVWQHRFYVPLAFLMGFGVPTLIGYCYGGGQAALGAFLLAGVARIVFVHHMTFCINSLCHWIGNRPYSSKCTARDSLLMAFFTFGEGYHNFHHEFQHDYRNGVKRWQYDPTKWVIWTLSKIGLVRNLRTVAEDKILKAQILEQQRQHAQRIAAQGTELCAVRQSVVQAMQETLHEAVAHWEERLNAWRSAEERRHEISAPQLRELRRQLNKATARLRVALRQWDAAHQF